MKTSLRRYALVVAGSSLALSALISAAQADQAGTVSRPPQFVAFAFDGSLNNDFWEESRAFSKGMRDKGSEFKFTYFLSCVYYLDPKYKSEYHGPHHIVGASDIGFGKGGADDIYRRINNTNAAFDEGNEVGSHACGHFDGSKWSQDDWAQDFASFDHFIFNIWDTNHLTPTGDQPSAWHFNQSNIKGFRAPLLGVSPGLWPVIAHEGMRYDTSRVNQTNYWPEKTKEGFWNFPLAAIKIAGTGKNTLSMDYNFYVAQTQAKPDPANSALYEKQMYETYVRYFMSNYNGNRAPVHIGHHFSKWNGGAYWRAMQHFAQTVCSLPEVKCVSYSELADFMDQVSPETRAAYQKGAFEKTPQPVNLAMELPASKNLELKVDAADESTVTAALVGEVSPETRVHWEVDGEKVAAGDSVSLDDLPLSADHAHEISAVATENGVEVQRATHVIRPSKDEDDAYYLSMIDRQGRALQGDLPEAHTGE